LAEEEAQVEPRAAVEVLLLWAPTTPLRLLCWSLGVVQEQEIPPVDLLCLIQLAVTSEPTVALLVSAPIRHLVVVVEEVSFRVARTH